MGKPESKVPLKGGGEYDIFTGWRRVLNIRPRFWKKKYRRRVRRLNKLEANMTYGDWCTRCGIYFDWEEGDEEPLMCEKCIEFEETVAAADDLHDKMKDDWYDAWDKDNG